MVKGVAGQEGKGGKWGGKNRRSAGGGKAGVRVKETGLALIALLPYKRNRCRKKTILYVTKTLFIRRKRGDTSWMK